MKAPSTIRTHLQFLADVQRPGSPFHEWDKHDAFVMQQALEWVLGRDAMNPTRFIAINHRAEKRSA